MSVSISIVNCSKEEKIDFSHLPFSSKGEILSNFVATKLITFYFLENIGDEIYLIEDDVTEDNWPLDVSMNTVINFKEVSKNLIDGAEAKGIISNRKKVVIDEDDDSLYFWNFD
tara:strand:+ start:5448 stop:5789 length:342 start_codon:yes stop_codon:yes gene_type:complete